jgi:succinate dehydrogenase / fumarate reductase cytochrome b subunit
MSNNNQKPSNFWKWFDPRKRETGTWAFALNRITAIGLTIYLYIHLVVLGKLAQGPDAFDSFVALSKSPLVIFGELLVVIGGLYHGLNGLRIALTSFGVAVPQQKSIFYGLLAITIIGSVVFAVRMFTV